MAFAFRAALALALFSASAALPASAVVCVDPDDASCLPTIQAGVNAAAPGEVVEVAAGLYNEEVAIATQGLVLRGGKGVFLDPSGLPDPAHAITVGAPNVVIEDLAVRNGDDSGIVVNGVGGVRIVDVDFHSPDDRCIVLNGATPDVVIEGSRFRSCRNEAVAANDADGLQLLGNGFEGSGGVDAAGDGVRAERNTWSRIGDTCLFIDGDGAVVTGNRLSLCADGIEIDGSDASVTRNTLVEMDGNAIDVDGDDPVIESNPITGTDGTGIALRCVASCGAARIYRNRLGSIGGTGIDAEGVDAGLRIEANQLSQVEGVALALETLGASVLGNRVSAAGGGGDECIDLDGDSNQVSGNSLASCGGDGIKADGDANVIEENRVSGTGDDGIDIDGGNTGNQVLDNQASGATDNGIEVSVDETGATVSDNQASGLHADYCDAGGGSGGTDVPDATTGCGDIDD
jgi:hypothetical protein